MKHKKTPPPFLTRVWYTLGQLFFCYPAKKTGKLVHGLASCFSSILSALIRTVDVAASYFSTPITFYWHFEFRHIYHLLSVKVLISKLDYSKPALLNYIPSFFSSCLRTVYGYFTPKRVRKNLVKSLFLSLCLRGENIVASFS